MKTVAKAKEKQKEKKETMFLCFECDSQFVHLPTKTKKPQCINCYSDKVCIIPDFDDMYNCSNCEGCDNKCCIKNF